MSKDQPITSNMMGAWVRKIGELSGFEHSTVCYSLRYMAGNTMDRIVNVSDTSRTLVIDYVPNSNAF
ncbi:hypothetical protein F5B21DRAFT_510101 [Xylaria acuta]|nr:hypothetical protein F5B21DRAFT_510101 [Xylaria acuta]